MKVCTICKQSKPLTEFSEVARRKGGFRSNCKTCGAKAAREWGEKNPIKKLESQKAYRDKRSEDPQATERYRGYLRKYYKENFGPKSTEWVSRQQLYRHHISNETFLDLLLRQNYACSACKSKFAKASDRYRRPYIDHDHSCCGTQGRSCGNCIRGLLCPMCNFVLGQVCNSATRLRQLAIYMESTKPMLFGDLETRDIVTKEIQ